MIAYFGVIIALCFIVDLLLLLGSNRLSGYPINKIRIVIAAIVGGVYGGACLLPELYFLCGTPWRLVCMCIVGWIAFGWGDGSMRRVTIYILLEMAMNGIAAGIGGEGVWTLLFSAAAFIVLYVVGFQCGVRNASYIPIELNYCGKSVRVTALRDTGNTLLDPVTGRSVIIVGADIANELLGLSTEQLYSPIETVSSGCLPGLRLVPYRSIERTGGLLVAMWLQEVRIGTWRGSSLVAFAPVSIGTKGAYQALTGG